MEKLEFSLNEGEKIYFASDFHLGAPSKLESDEREKLIVSWLDNIKGDAKAIFLVGDIFDFWFEYRDVIPKGFIRFQSKLLELKDQGISVYLFHGNHDMWMFDYFPNEFAIPVFRDNILLEVNSQKIFLGHGDGLGPGDYTYKILKKVFRNPFCQWLFNWIHPNVGMWIAKKWSSQSRLKNLGKEDKSLENEEWLLTFSREIEKNSHHDYYIFGHRHLPLELEVSQNSKYINLGEWVYSNTYAILSDSRIELLKYEK